MTSMIFRKNNRIHNATLRYVNLIVTVLNTLLIYDQVINDPFILHLHLDLEGCINNVQASIILTTEGANPRKQAIEGASLITKNNNKPIFRCSVISDSSTTNHSAESGHLEFPDEANLQTYSSIQNFLVDCCQD